MVVHKSEALSDFGTRPRFPAAGCRECAPAEACKPWLCSLLPPRERQAGCLSFREGSEPGGSVPAKVSSPRNRPRCGVVFRCRVGWPISKAPRAFAVPLRLVMWGRGQACGRVQLPHSIPPRQDAANAHQRRPANLGFAGLCPQGKDRQDAWAFRETCKPGGLVPAKVSSPRNRLRCGVVRRCPVWWPIQKAPQAFADHLHLVVS